MGGVINTKKWLGFAAFGITLLYPPLVFYGFMNDTFRIALFGLVLLCLFFSQLMNTYHRSNFGGLIYCWIILAIYTVAGLYVNINGSIRSTIGYAMILFFSICLFSMVKAERNEKFPLALLKYYVAFFYVVPVLAVANFVINIFLPSFNFLTPYLAENPYHYNISPFGLSVTKPIFGINFGRNFFYFVEPVYLALFYLVNVFVIGPIVGKRSLFVKLNIIGGIVTFSYLFFAGYIILKTFQMRKLYRVVIISLVVIFYLAFQSIALPGLLETSSVDNRFFRIETALQFIGQIGIGKILFGIGIEYEYISDFGINAGLLSTVIENGIFGLFFLSSIMLLFAQKNKFIIVIILLGLLTVEPFKLPLFWLAVVLAGEMSKAKYIDSLNPVVVTQLNSAIH
jgi:hypothetical protein